MKQDLEVESYDDNKGYDFYWDELSSWEFNWKYNFTDEFVESVLKEHGIQVEKEN